MFISDGTQMTCRFYGVFLLTAACAAFGTEQTTIITNATVLSSERSSPLVNAWVRIDQGMITTVGTGPVDISESNVIDAEGGFLIPGLIDSHVHLYHATGLKRRYTKDYDELYRAYMEQQPRSFLYFGFTTVIELNADTATNSRFESAPIHPHVVHCGQGIILPDGFMALELEGESIDRAFPGYLIDHYADGQFPEDKDAEGHSPEAAVQYVKQHGGRCVKLYYEEALWWPGGAPDFRLPSVSIVRDVVSAAHAQNMSVVLHATTPNGHKFAVETGVDVLAHGMWEWPDQPFDAPEPLSEYKSIAGRVAESEIGLQPTVNTIRNTASLFDDSLLTDPNWNHVIPSNYMNYLQTDGQSQRKDFLARFASELGDEHTVEDLPYLMKAFASRYESLIGRMDAEGANLLFGTDTAIGGFGWASPPGLAGYWEAQAWVRAGVSLGKLFESLTIGNARAFGLDEEIGTVESGKRADLLILTSSPLDNVAAYNTITRVILNGELITRESLSARKHGREN